ncbi:EF-P lysine aminoacylase EpmA [Polyangium mundeleinium]|uniref:EF-P lysine aminoacylase EpmA n=1 Tax=Polyangium mundeleinium TaxID=2995306 RepID=A0ABT5ENM1_9BACT|nr:EF-P lysine aminoacylase EpmA [Polyangium mundeleinium]MDC0743438.1 EF-P lysine aminoacylase EpmA [Polyangium mundeleinium]
MTEPQVSPFAPGDLDTLAGAPGPIRVAGRVLDVVGDEIVLADAFARVTITLAEGSLAPADLAIVEASFVAGRLACGRVVERHTPNTPNVSQGAASEAPETETERLVFRGVGRALRARAEALAEVRSFFVRRGFLEVETPSMVPCPGLDLHLDAFGVGFGAQDAEGDPKPRALTTGAPEGRPLWLITSPEYQMKRLLAGGVPRCFQLARCYRRGEIGSRHNPEFTMLEWYRAFAPMDAVVADTEELVRSVVSKLAGTRVIEVEGTRVDLSAPFERISVGEAFARYAGTSADEAITMASEDEDRFFRLLVEHVEPSLARLGRPVFLVEYPAPFASLARLCPADPRVAERFELYVGSVEVCNGFGELTDPVEQRARFERDQAQRRAEGKPVYPIDERFLAALAEGMPPAAGNALGIDRLVALGLGARAIGDVTAFPYAWL